MAGFSYQEYRIAESRFGRFAFVMACAAAGWLVLFCTDDTLPGIVRVGLVGAGLFGVAALTAWAWFASTMTGPDGVMVRRYLRTTTYAWSDVQDIRIELNPASYLGHEDAPRHVVVLYDKAGRRVGLPNVNEKNLGDLGFVLATEFDAMRAAWHSRRGPDWVPLPRVQRMIDERRRYDATPSMVGMLAALLAVPVTAVIFVVGLFTHAYALPTPLSWLFQPGAIGIVPAVVFVIATVVTTLSRRRAQVSQGG